MGNNINLIFYNEELLENYFKLINYSDYKLDVQDSKIYMSVHSLPKEVLIAITRNFVSNKTNDSLVIERKKKIFVKKYNGFFSDFMEKMYGEKYYEKFLKMAEDYIKKLEVFRMEKYEEISIEQIQKIVSKQKLEVKQENSKVVIPLSFKDLKIVYPFSLNEYIYILD